MRKIGKKILLVFLDLILAAAMVGGTWSWNYLIPRGMKVEAAGMNRDSMAIDGDWHEKFADQFTETVESTP